MAIRYADAMASDPVRGIYQGDEEDGRGQVWYWRDVGVYMTNYTMRVPPAFLDLAQDTGRRRYADIAALAGQQLLRSQCPEIGILRKGWRPRPPSDPALAVRRDELTRPHLSDTKINSRVGYSTLSLARMHLHTGDRAYLDVLNRFLEGFEHYQYPDGSFPEDGTRKIKVVQPQAKGHFHHYILNGIAKAACLLPQAPALGRIAERLGWYVALQQSKLGSVVYGDLDSTTPTEGPYWTSSVPDGIVGFAWLAKWTGQAFYREIACRIAVQALLRVWDCPDAPDVDGVLPHWITVQGRPEPCFTGHFHFMTILGLQALEETAVPSDPMYRARE